MKKDFIYLASASPRRSALLEQIGVAHRVQPADISETRERDEPSERYVVRLAEQKASAIWEQTPGEGRRPVLAADTTVALDERLLGKPRDAADALAAAICHGHQRRLNAQLGTGKAIAGAQ